MSSSDMNIRSGSRQELHYNPYVLLLHAYLCPWLGIGRPLERHPFSGLGHSADETDSTSMTPVLLSK